MLSEPVFRVKVLEKIVNTEVSDGRIMLSK